MAGADERSPPGRCGTRPCPTRRTRRRPGRPTPRAAATSRSCSPCRRDAGRLRLPPAPAGDDGVQVGGRARRTRIRVKPAIVGSADGARSCASAPTGSGAPHTAHRRTRVSDAAGGRSGPDEPHPMTEPSVVHGPGRAGGRRQVVFTARPRRDHPGGHGQDEHHDDQGQGRGPCPLLGPDERLLGVDGRSGRPAWCWCRGRRSSWAWAAMTPIVNSSGAVSPAARATASRHPLVMPGRAAGSTTVRIGAGLACGRGRSWPPADPGAPAQHGLGRTDHDRQHEAGEGERAAERRSAGGYCRVKMV